MGIHTLYPRRSVKTIWVHLSGLNDSDYPESSSLAPWWDTQKLYFQQCKGFVCSSQTVNDVRHLIKPRHCFQQYISVRRSFFTNVATPSLRKRNIFAEIARYKSAIDQKNMCYFIERTILRLHVWYTHTIHGYRMVSCCTDNFVRIITKLYQPAHWGLQASAWNRLSDQIFRSERVEGISGIELHMIPYFTKSGWSLHFFNLCMTFLIKSVRLCRSDHLFGIRAITQIIWMRFLCSVLATACTASISTSIGLITAK